MDSSIKSLTITGSAAEDAMRPRRVGSRKKRQPDTEEEKEFIENAKSLVISRNSPQPEKPEKSVKPVQPEVKPEIKPEVKPIIQIKAEVKPFVPQHFPEESKVILKPPKNLRVKLQPKVAPIPQMKNQSRKARKIHLTVANLNHRFTRAKRVKDETEKKPVNTIREYLVQRGVIQGKSKAPEKMLRSMYSDFMLLKDQAL